MSAISVSWLNVSWGAVYFETNYGLMQHSYSEITNKLLGALDSEYNVLDMATVFEIVSVLERTPITTEILEILLCNGNEKGQHVPESSDCNAAVVLLEESDVYEHVFHFGSITAPHEATRLGKVINECRRRTSNEALARRAKHLVRHWRDMMIAPPSAPSSTVVSPSAPPIPQQNGTNARSSNPATAVAHNANRVATPTISVSPALSTSSSAGGRGSCSSSNVYDSKVSPSSSLSPGGDPKVESVPKTHVANKRLRKNAASPVAGEPPIKVAKVNGAAFAERVGEMSEDSTDYDFVVAAAATTTTTTRLRDPQPQPFVTEEDEDGDGPSSSSSAARGIVAEPVPQQESPLPKKRSRKKGGKRKPQADDIVKEKLVALSKAVRVKTTEELVAELKSRSENRLSTAAAIASSASDCLPNATAKPSLPNHVHAAAGSAESSLLQADLERLDPETRVEREIAAILAKLPPVNADEIVWDSTPESSAPTTPRPPVTEDEVERYLRQPWPDVNGCVTHAATAASEDDDGSGFREWHEMVARRTTDDALIHILPYSIVD